MTHNIQQLHIIANKKSRLIIGLMSGTSLDGLDVALCKISGSRLSTKVQLLKFKTVSYTEEIKNSIREVFAKSTIDFLKLTELNAHIGELHGNMVMKCLRQWKVKPSLVDVIASHGQTVFHAPKSSTPNATRNSTLQIGDGDHLAARTGIITISDFRQKHIAHGGEGAPLALYGDYILFSMKGEDRIMLNLGGIGNFTYLPASEKVSEILVTDTGPSNTIIDQAAQKIFNMPFDTNGAIAEWGHVSKKLLTALKAHRFFKLPFPKTTGPELFNLEFVKQAQQQSATKKIDSIDLMTTITQLSADTIADAIKKVVGKKIAKIFISGGGAHNLHLVDLLKQNLPDADFQSIKKLGIPGDAKEAVLFAVLAS